MQAEYKIIGADGREYGPATLDELIEWVREGRVGRQTQVWSSTDERWTPAGRMTELAAWIGAMPDHSTPVEIARAGFEAPVLFVIGHVVSLYDPAPLAVGQAG